jgi:hypothetical protein
MAPYEPLGTVLQQKIIDITEKNLSPGECLASRQSMPSTDSMREFSHRRLI